jgi:hypothetical protein
MKIVLGFMLLALAGLTSAQLIGRSDTSSQLAVGNSDTITWLTCSPTSPVFQQRNSWKLGAVGNWSHLVNIYALNATTGLYDFVQTTNYFQNVVYDQAGCTFNETQIWPLGGGLYAIQAYQLDILPIAENSLRDPQRYGIVSLTPPIPGSPDLRQDVGISIQLGPKTGAISFSNPATGAVDLEEFITWSIPNQNGDYTIAAYQQVPNGYGGLINVKVSTIDFKCTATVFDSCISNILRAWNAGQIPLNTQVNSYLYQC